MPITFQGSLQISRKGVGSFKGAGACGSTSYVADFALIAAFLSVDSPQLQGPKFDQNHGSGPKGAPNAAISSFASRRPAPRGAEGYELARGPYSPLKWVSYQVPDWQLPVLGAQNRKLPEVAPKKQHFSKRRRRQVQFLGLQFVTFSPSESRTPRGQA